MEKYVYSPEWAKLIRQTIRSQMALHDVSYFELRKRLADIGTHQSEANLRNKVSKGTLGAQLFVQILLVVGCKSLELDQVQKLLVEISQRNEDH